MSATMPTTVSHGVGSCGLPRLIRLPSAFSFGQNDRAIDSLITMDILVVLVSLHVTSRPERSGIDIAPKYPGETVRKSTSHTWAGAVGCPSTATPVIRPVAASGTAVVAATDCTPGSACRRPII